MDFQIKFIDKSRKLSIKNEIESLLQKLLIEIEKTEA